METLKDLFDKKIVDVLELFIENQGKKFFLSEISNRTKINITTTFRIVNKLIEKGFIKSSTIGKTKAYELENNKKTQDMIKFLKKEDDPIQLLIQEISLYPRIKKIILESRDKKNARILIVGNFLPKDRIDKKIQDIKIKYGFEISYVEITEEQYKELKNFKSYALEEKIIWSSSNLNSF